ncbi:MAG: apolipoprotein N-acyltransferase [Armatimonadetes bacterium]|nr:apolipoprotein N-acyltransferase [Armatimonadota bacterium]
MKKRNLCLAIISGIIMALAMPKPGIWPLAWVGLAPLFVAMRASAPRTAALYGFVMAAVYFGIICFWLTIFGYLPWFASVLVLMAVPAAVFAAVSSRLMPNKIGLWGYIAVPAVWTAMQWMRSLGPLGFTWGSFAHLQANVPSIVQLGSVTGPWGIDFLICLFNLALANAIFPAPARRRFAPIAAASIIALAVIAGGNLAIESAPKPKTGANIAIIQGDLPHEVDISPEYLTIAYRRYADMTRKASASGADIVVWPETALPVRITGAWDSLVSDTARKNRVNCIIGGLDPSSDPYEPRSYNAALFYDRLGRKTGAYHKVHLVPYGEYVPLRKQMPWLERYGVRPVDVLPGKSFSVAPTEMGGVGVSICFESLFPQISRLETRNSASMLIVMTNDSWFLQTQAARGHLMMAKLRAVENRRYLIRAAGTGISAIIDPYGRSVTELDIFRSGIVSGRISPLHTFTIYTRIGDTFAYACVLVALCALGISLRRSCKPSVG